MITGRELVEKLYSQIEEEERLYSTGDSELDDLLEKAFCDGYECAQREFAESEEEKEKNAGGGLAVALGGGSAIGAGKLAKRDQVRAEKAADLMYESRVNELAAEKTAKLAENEKVVGEKLAKNSAKLKEAEDAAMRSRITDRDLIDRASSKRKLRKARQSAADSERMIQLGKAEGEKKILKEMQAKEGVAKEALAKGKEAAANLVKKNKKVYRYGGLALAGVGAAGLASDAIRKNRKD